MRELIFYGSYLVFPFILFLLFKKRINKIKRIFFIILSLIFIYSRFIEPQIIFVNKIQIDLGFKTKIALVSDLHIGKYKKEDFLKKVVDKINTLDVDYVMIAGDFTYYPEKEDIKKLFLPLKDLKKPTFYVLGNHDVERPGPKVREELKNIFNEFGLNFLNNNEIDLGNFKLVGLGSYLNNEDNVSLLDKYSLKDNIIVLAHNPDTTSKYKNKNADLTLCGHTHGGQIRIPFLYKKIIPTVGDFDKGLTKEKNTLLYISSGVGETFLPMRLFNFPTIDLIEVK